jgi:hypothetical protein
MVLFATPDFGASGCVVLLFPLAGGILCGLISIAVCLTCPRSRLGFRLGMLSVIWGVVLPLLCFCLAGRELAAIAYPILASPILPGLLGIGLSRLPAGLGLRIARVGGVLVFATAVLLIIQHWYGSARAGQEMMRLLDGKGQGMITSMRIDGGQRRVTCTDRAVCDYITNSVRKAIRGRGTELALGASYAFTFQLDSGSLYYVECACVFDKGFSLSIPEAHSPEAGWMTHQVDFPEPIPERLQQIWQFLHRSDTKVLGTIMTVEEGSLVRLDYDRRLDLERRNEPDSNGQHERTGPVRNLVSAWEDR